MPQARIFPSLTFSRIMRCGTYSTCRFQEKMKFASHLEWKAEIPHSLSLAMLILCDSLDLYALYSRFARLSLSRERFR
jgi:hypothetical protein